MNNYEYIIASLPVLSREDSERVNAAALIEDTREQLGEKDNALVDFLLTPSQGGELNADYYRRAAESGSRFIREYMAFDRRLRNAKVAWLNTALGREEGQDMLFLSEDEAADPWSDFPEKEEADAALGGSDILGRERALDSLMWRKIDEISVFEYFSADAVLAFLAKLSIVERWLRLDENTGRELFRRLVAEIKENRTKEQ